MYNFLKLTPFFLGTCNFSNFPQNTDPNTQRIESFGLILQKLKLICVIGTIETYLGFWGERLNFSITIAEIQPKVWERRCKRRKEKMLNFGNVDTEIPLPSSAARTLSPVCPSVECPVKKKKGNCGNAIDEIGEKKKIFFW